MPVHMDVRKHHNPIRDQYTNSLVADDLDIRLEGMREGFDIRIVFQPPNSPDMNVLDLGYFRSIQAFQHQHPSNSTGELIANVKKSFVELDKISLEDTFLTHQACMTETLREKGGNNYKLPHIHKSHRRKEGETLRTLECPAEVWYPAQRALQAIRMDKENVS
jgi:hypothetical protein